MAKNFSSEVTSGQRFEFGKNWGRFLKVLNEERIAQAERSLLEMLGDDNLRGKRFLDIGPGSGLFSLAAKRMGATVHSFDFDPQSVACTQELRRRYFPDEETWTIEEGSVLDTDYVTSLGLYHVVYSWGVLHHTGDLKRALENALLPVAEGGLLYIAIYNDQGLKSRLWTKVKQLYCSGKGGRLLMLAVFFPFFSLSNLLVDLVRLRNPYRRYKEYKHQRGMSMVHDWVDWLGGYPFEAEKPEEIFNFYYQRNFELVRLKTTHGLGNNEFVFKKKSLITAGNPVTDTFKSA
jgi:2-polyprenyl-6-hydroxyphenyl methylase/3-demethylubiquinone-9 3-methyltransferase